MGRHLKEWQVLAIIDLYEMRLPRGWVARVMGVDESLVVRALNLVGYDGAPELSAERYDLLATLVNQGMSRSEIARLLRMDQRMVVKHFPDVFGEDPARYRWGKRSPHPALTREQVEEIYELYDLHLPRTWVAWTLNISTKKVNAALRLVGVQTSRTEIPAEKYVRLAQMVNEETPMMEIMRTLHMDRRTIQRYFPDYKPLPVGHSETAATIREANKVLRA